MKCMNISREIKLHIDLNNVLLLCALLAQDTLRTRYADGQYQQLHGANFLCAKNLFGTAAATFHTLPFSLFNFRCIHASKLLLYTENLKSNGSQFTDACFCHIWVYIHTRTSIKSAYCDICRLFVI